MTSNEDPTKVKSSTCALCRRRKLTSKADKCEYRSRTPPRKRPQNSPDYNEYLSTRASTSSTRSTSPSPSNLSFAESLECLFENVLTFQGEYDVLNLSLPSLQSSRPPSDNGSEILLPPPGSAFPLSHSVGSDKVPSNGEVAAPLLSPDIKPPKDRAAELFRVRNLFLEHGWQYGLNIPTEKRDAISRGDASGHIVHPVLIHVCQLLGYLLANHSHEETWVYFQGQTDAEVEQTAAILDFLEGTPSLVPDPLTSLQAYTMLAIYCAQKVDLGGFRYLLAKAGEVVVEHQAALGLDDPPELDRCPQLDGSQFSPNGPAQQTSHERTQSHTLEADRLNDGTPRAVWSGGQEVLVVAYDVMIPGCYTKTTSNLRLLESKPKRRFDLNSFNAGDYEKAVDSSNSAAAITSVLYPSFGKELRLEQQYFWTAVSLADILRRFKNIGKPITEFPDYVAIQLNDTHPTLAIPELVRILIDEEDQPWDTVWRIVTNTFYTNHTVLLEALEKWPVPLLEHLLPRHLQILYDINMLFLHGGEEVPGRPRSAGTYEEEGLPKQLQSDLVKTTIMKDFVEFEGITKFGNVTNGITPRRWLDQCDPELRALVFWTLKIDRAVWLKDLYQLEKLLPFTEDAAFRDKWAAIKQRNKERLVHHVQTTLGLTINTQAMFDVQIKRLHEYRQTLNILGVIYGSEYAHARLFTEVPHAEEHECCGEEEGQPRVMFFAVKAAPRTTSSSSCTIRLIVNVARIINADPDTKDLLSLYFLPDYSVSLAEVLIPASDISRHISTADTEASGTSNMKFCLNGGLLLGTVVFFGHLTPAVEDLRYQHTYHPIPIHRCRAAAAADIVLARRVARAWPRHGRCCTSRMSNGGGAETVGVWRARCDDRLRRAAAVLSGGGGS
ncbi:hypothetical protein C8J57DRAFT_1573595 [Mycena rebaudengoi]|nr:hypothetical protein C8J57DRAFT_1573595 [Mycena rebaudengoi]